MPVLFENDVDRSDLAIGIAKALFQDYDFNEGQTSIINSANYRSNVTQRVTYDIQGIIWEVTSEIKEYYFDIQVSHPEAVDESLYSVLEDTKSYIYELFEETNYVPRGELSDDAIAGNSHFSSILSKVGLFR
jgi:hypothetical protein